MLNDLFDFYFIGCCGGAGFSGKPSPAMVFEYELLDEDNSGNGFGLFYYNGTPNPAPPASRTLLLSSVIRVRHLVLGSLSIAS